MTALDTGPLFESVRLAGSTLPNRFVMPGMQRGMCEQGAPRREMTEYFARRVAGGVGMIITESLAVDHPSATQNVRFGRVNEATAEGWRNCIEKVKASGGHIIMQLWHEGGLRPEGGDNPDSHEPTLSPSGFANAGRRAGRAATARELEEIREGFVRSARIAQRAGAHGVEVHAAHGYLLDQFLWAATNQRTDGFGGAAIADRIRFPAEVVAAIREACGADFIISFRFSQWKESDFEARVADTPEELETMLSALRDAGASAIHASTRRFWQSEWSGSDLNLAGWCSKLSDLPVITVGSVGLNVDLMDGLRGAPIEARIREGIEELLRRLSAGEFALISVGRSLIADPNWVAKVRAGDFDQIRTFERSDTKKTDAEVAALAEQNRRD